MALFVKEAAQLGDEEKHITRASIYVTAAELEALSGGESADGFDVKLPPSVILAEPHMIVTLRRMPAEMADRHKIATATGL